MNYLKTAVYIAKYLVVLVASLLFSCGENTPHQTGQPKLSDYFIGETWVWKYKGQTTAGEVRSDGEDRRVIVKTTAGLGMTIENDTIQVSTILKEDDNEAPRYKWPLHVGKKWKYEKNWTSQDGTTGSQSQDVEVLSYQKETVGAGTFMAYTIKYTGTITNSRGYNAEVEDIWVYAPKVKNFIKLTQTQDDFLYVEELIAYSNPNKQ